MVVVRFWFSIFYLFPRVIRFSLHTLSLLSTLFYSVKMEFGINSTLIPSADDPWSGYFPDSPSRVALLAFINIPLIAIALNVLRQLVHRIVTLPMFFADILRSSCLKTPHCHQKFSTSYPFLARRQATATIPLPFWIPAAKRCDATPTPAKPFF